MIKIDIDTRCWQIPREEAFLGVESDDKVKILQFELSKNEFCGGLNFTDCNCFINYKNEGNDTIPYLITDMEVQVDGTVTFTWEVSRGATIFKGNTFAVFCAKKVREDGTITNEWNSRIGSFTVAKGLEPSSSITEVPEIDIISQLLSVAQKTNAKAETNINQSSSLLEKAEGLRDQVSELKEELADLEDTAYGEQYIKNLTEFNAAISGSNVWSISSNGANKCLFVPVNGGETLHVKHKSGITFHMAFLKAFAEPVSGETPSFCDGYESRIVIPVSTLEVDYIIPSDCRCIYVLIWNGNADYSPDSFVVNGIDIIDTYIGQIERLANKYTDEKISEVNGDILKNTQDIADIGNKLVESYDVSPETNDGYTRYTTGVITTYSGDGKYVTTGRIPFSSDVVSIESNFTGNAEAGYAFYDENETYIDGGLDQTSISPVPQNARYISLSDYSANATHTGLKITFKNKPLMEIEDLVTCYGDSTVEGLGMEDIGTATYGGDTMPSHLYTLLKDNGYSVVVENMGHSGERTTETCARIGGRVCAYLGEDITIPSSNKAQSLGVAMTNDSVVTGSKMFSTGKNADGTTPTVLLTKLGHHTRPVLVGSYECNIWQASQDGGMLQTIQLTSKQSNDIVLPKYSPIVFGSSLRNPSVNVVHMGINDGANMSLTEYVDRVKSIIERNPKTIVCGLYNGAWKWWRNMTGSTDDAKREEYNLACLSNFGAYFINLYDIFCTERCIDIAKEGGYLTDRTDEQIVADNTAFENGHTCPSLTYEGTENEPHFNSIGYYVFAKVIYDKIVALGLIDKQ